MARSRMIKPNFFDDEKLAYASRDCRLFFVGMWVCSDDYGRIKGNPLWLKSNIFPYDEDLTRADIENFLFELEKIGAVIPYEHHGERFLLIVNFKKHQKVDKPSKTTNPDPPDDIFDGLAKDSRESREDSPRAPRNSSEGSKISGDEVEVEVESGNRKNISPSGDMSPESDPETSSGYDSESSAKEKKSTPNCPQEEIKTIYHEELPELPPIRVWGECSQKNLRARWREDPERQSLIWWRQFFREFIRSSDFLMGRKTDFQASLDWIAKPQNFQKIMNGNYVNRSGKPRRIEADQIDFRKKYEDFDDFDVVEGNYA